MRFGELKPLIRLVLAPASGELHREVYRMAPPQLTVASTWASEASHWSSWPRRSVQAAMSALGAKPSPETTPLVGVSGWLATNSTGFCGSARQRCSAPSPVRTVTSRAKSVSRNAVTPTAPER